jgi:hypothetical protein
MEHELLTDYLEREVEVFLVPSPAGLPATEEGKLFDCGPSGVILEQDGGAHLFIPMAAVRSIRIQPKPTLWQRLTGT